MTTHPDRLAQAYAEILDTLIIIQRYAAHCPFGPDVMMEQPRQGWCYTLPGDPGHRWDVTVNTPQQWMHDGVVRLWFRTGGCVTTEWVLEARYAVWRQVWQWRWYQGQRIEAHEPVWRPAPFEPLMLLPALTVFEAVGEQAQ